MGSYPVVSGYALVHVIFSNAARNGPYRPVFQVEEKQGTSWNPRGRHLVISVGAAC